MIAILLVTVGFLGADLSQAVIASEIPNDINKESRCATCTDTVTTIVRQKI